MLTTKISIFVASHIYSLHFKLFLPANFVSSLDGSSFESPKKFLTNFLYPSSQQNNLSKFHFTFNESSILFNISKNIVSLKFNFEFIAYFF